MSCILISILSLEFYFWFKLEFLFHVKKIMQFVSSKFRPRTKKPIKNLIKKTSSMYHKINLLSNNLCQLSFYTWQNISITYCIIFLWFYDKKVIWISEIGYNRILNKCKKFQGTVWRKTNLIKVLCRIKIIKITYL